MKYLLVICVTLVACRQTAPSQARSLAANAAELRAGFAALVEQRDEPIGLAALADHPKLGLIKGDVVQMINGMPARRDSDWARSASAIFLDVVRGGDRVAIRIDVEVEREQREIVPRMQLERVIDSLRRNSQSEVAVVTKRGEPSGLVVTSRYGLWSGMNAGDILRRIDKVAVTSPETAAALFDRAKDNPQTVVDLERQGKPVTLTLMIEAAPAPADMPTPSSVATTADSGQIERMIATITKLDDTTFEIPRKVVDEVLANPAAMVKGARIVPSIANGRPNGFKLYAIRPNSMYAALGLSNGDTIVAINGQEMTTADKALEIYVTLRRGNLFKVELLRRGKPLTFEYRIR